MALALSIIFALIFIASYVLMNNKILRPLIAGISLLGLITNLTLITYGDNAHWGMTEKTVTKTTVIHPVANLKQFDVNMMLKKPLGTQNESIVLYKTAPKSKVVNTAADVIVTNKFKRVNDYKHATLTTTTKKYVINSHLYRLMYAGLKLNNAKIKVTNTFKLPANWVVLTPEKANQLKKQMNSQQTDINKVMAPKIKAAIMAAKMQNPQLTKKQEQAIAKKVTAQANRAIASKVQQQLMKMSIE